MNKDKVVIGIDESTADTGITIAVNGEVFRVFDVELESLPNHTERRDELRNRLKAIVKELLKYYDPINIICIIERIRLKSQGFISMDFIQSVSALNGVIIDVMYHNKINVYSVDTRSWKSAVTGSSTPLKNEYGIDPKKYPTILWCVKHGYKKYIVNYCVGKKKKKGVIEKNGKRYTYNDNRADSICIALYGFLPQNKRKLEQEH